MPSKANYKVHYHHWSKSEIDRVKELAAQGKAAMEVASIISRELGEKISVNSIERLHRTYGISFFSRAKKREEKEMFREEKNEIVGDKWVISLPKTEIHTLEELVEHCKIDLSIWEVERFICNKWEVGMRPASVTEYMTTKDGREIPAWTRETGEPIVIPLFQVKAFLRKKVFIVDAKEEIESLKRMAFGFKLPPEVSNKRGSSSENLLEVCISDHHFGKLAWGEETGHGNYDVKIARELFNTALDSLIDRTRSHKFEEIIFVVGNDLLNSDDVDNKTTWGTPQTTDGRYQKTFAVVRTLMVEAIEKLRLFSRVKVIMVPGNHDRLSIWHLGDSLECWFNKYSDVEIDNRPLYRKYHRFGNVMLMFTHGDKGKMSDYPLLMATEQPQMFGETKFREIHTAHTHQVSLKEQNGVRVRVLPSLGQPDDWHSDRGFVGNIRSAEAFIWNKIEGLTGMVFYSDSSMLEKKGLSIDKSKRYR